MGDELAAAAPNLSPPPGNPRFPLCDGLRAAAAIAVFLGHTVTQVYGYTAHRDLFLWSVQLADQGVALFFVLSGFLLYRPFLVARAGGPRLGLASYALRRVLRIVPAYWVSLSILLLLGLVGGVNGGNWWVFYGFGQIYSRRTIGGGIGVAWTLCIEVTFYLALPLFSALACRLGAGRRRWRSDIILLALLGAGSLAFRWRFSAFGDYATADTLPGTFVWFGLGMALALLSVAERPALSGGEEAKREAAPAAAWAAASLLFLAFGAVARHLSGAATVTGEYLLYGVIALLVCLPAVLRQGEGGLLRRAMGLRGLGWMGLVSYSVYLYHPVIITRAERLLVSRGTPFYPALLICAAALTLAGAALSYYLVERPGMRLARR